MHPLLAANSVITESLAPALGITGTALLINGLTGHFHVVTGRVRALNQELRNSDDPLRIENIKQQQALFMRRVRLMRNAIFLLVGAVGMMIFTVVAIALSRLAFVNWQVVPIFSFLGGLALALSALGFKAYESALSLRTLSLDVQYALDKIRNN